MRALLLCDHHDQSSIWESDVTVGVAAGHVRFVSGTPGSVTLKFSIALKSPAVVSRFPSDGKLKVSSANRNTEENSTCVWETCGFDGLSFALANGEITIHGTRKP